MELNELVNNLQVRFVNHTSEIIGMTYAGFENCEKPLENHELIILYNLGLIEEKDKGSIKHIKNKTHLEFVKVEPHFTRTLFDSFSQLAKDKRAKKRELLESKQSTFNLITLLFIGISAITSVLNIFTITFSIGANILISINLLILLSIFLSHLYKSIKGDKPNATK